MIKKQKSQLWTAEKIPGDPRSESSGRVHVFCTGDRLPMQG